MLEQEYLNSNTHVQQATDEVAEEEALQYTGGYIVSKLEVNNCV